MYAIIKTGGKQYRVENGTELKVEKLDANVGDKVVFDEVLALGDGEFKTGNPYIDGCSVEAEVLEQGKNEKVIIYKYKAKKDYRKKNGHRQPYTLVKITSIGGAKAPKSAVKKAEPKAEKAAAEEAKPAGDIAKASMSMKKDELLQIAKDNGIKVASSATKADILAAIQGK